MAKWKIDPVHSEVTFTVKHLMITNVKGDFKKFSAEVEAEDETFKAAKISFTADVNSLDTRNEQRDRHLKSADFFDGEKHPQLKFEAKKYEGEELLGDLTIRGITKPVKLQVEFGGVAKDPWGNIKAGFSVSGKINRKDWGLNWNAALETGGVMVGDEVKIRADIQLVKE